MFGFLTFGTTLTFLDQAFKARIEKEEKGTFPSLPSPKER